MPKGLLTPSQAAGILGYHPHYVYKLLQRGVLAGEKYGASWMIERSEVERVKSLQGKGGRLPKTKRKR